MAKAGWLEVTPTEGSGNASVQVSSISPNTGRNMRSSILTFTAANVEDVERTVNQAGKPEFSKFVRDAVTVEAQTTVLGLVGSSNSSRLTFSTGIGDLDVTLAPKYTANSIETINGADIDGDPGAQAEYVFSMQIAIAAYEDNLTRARQVIVEDAIGNKAYCRVVLDGEVAYIQIEDKTIELDYLGTPVSVAVQSNTSWKVI